MNLILYFMKRIILILILNVICITGFSQLIKYRTQSFSECTLNKVTGEWVWAPDAKTNVLITIDLDNLRIKLYTAEVLVYEIVRFDDESTTEDGDIVTSLSCIDRDGKPVGIRHLKPKRNNLVNQLYIDFPETIFLFNMNRLD